MMWWGNGSWGVGSWVAMGLMMVVGSGAVIALGVWALRGNRSKHEALPTRSGSARADQELCERFARGEIDEAQFTRARAILRADNNRLRPTNTLKTLGTRTTLSGAVSGSESLPATTKSSEPPGAL